MDRKIAFLFPGQGSQYVGMGKDFYDTFPTAKRVFERAENLLSIPICSILFNGPIEVLSKTLNSQLGIYINSMAILEVLKEKIPEIVPVVCSGLSLGEYTALCASNRISFEQGLELIERRARYMSQACHHNPGTMVAVIGLDAKDVHNELSRLHAQYKVWVANFNYPKQVVISGSYEGVKRGIEVLKARGAGRVVPLSVEGAFHTKMMMEAQKRLALHINKLQLKNSPIDLVMNRVGDYVYLSKDIKRCLIEQMTSSVKWEQGIRSMMKKEIDLYLEIGCGSTLTAMNRKIKIEDTCLSLDRVEDLDKVSKEVNGEPFKR